VDVDSLYRSLDKLHSRYKDSVEAISYDHTKKILGPTISIIFYDMTTLYFEAEDEDDLRKIGFSKDGKFQHPQIMLGLLVGKGGYPISYDIFEGNTFEGHTLLPVLKRIEKKYGFKDVTVIADAAMLSKHNLKKLCAAQYQFIVGGRIKNESTQIQEQILKSLKFLHNGGSLDLTREDGTRLIVTYSTQRAKKDAHNRDRGLAKLKQRMRLGKLTKEHLNNRGYNKFLVLEGTVAVSLDNNKIAADAQWDGLKGYVTNTDLQPEMVVENYRELWQIEKAFRISKTDLRIRPIYHFRKRRIEAHICIAFAAYAIIKELEHQLQTAGIIMSPKRAGELTHNMYQLTYMLPHSKKRFTRILEMDAEQKILTNLIR
jgi:transposase